MHTILHIGAGQATELSDWLKTGAERIVLVEPNPELAENLRQKTSGEPRVTVVEAAVACNSANNHLYVYNLPEASSLHLPTGLKALFPGLKTIATHRVATLSPEQLIEDYGPQTGQPTMLVLQCPGEEHAIIQALVDTDQLKQFTRLLLVANPEPYYKSSQASEQTLQLLADYGYNILQESDQDPDWPSWELARNALIDKVTTLESQNQSMKDLLREKNSGLQRVVEKKELISQQLNEAKRQNTYLQQQLEQVMAETESHKVEAERQRTLAKERAETIAQNDSQLQTLKKQNEELVQRLADASEALSKLQKALITNTDRLAEQSATNAKLDELEKKVVSLGRNLSKHVDRKLVNTAKQIEISMGLQEYLKTGELPLSYHGWPISPDLALYLAEKVEAENYDLIIEFGSGTSTVLFAKVLMKKLSEQKCISEQRTLGNGLSDRKNSEPMDEHETSWDSDLPKRILTFEHKEYYREQTASLLKREGLEQLVNLVHAPLIDFSFKGEDYLYYDCDRTLEKVAELYEGRNPRILVFVDGPPGSTGPNARFPAIPKLLNFIPKARFHVVLDDYNRAEEKNIAEMWIELIKRRSESFSEVQLPFEKGAICISINME